MAEELKISAWGVPPEHPTLADDEVHVWHARLNVRLANEGLPVLSRAERREMKRQEVTKHFAGGRYMVRALLGLYTGQDPARLKLDLGPDDRLVLEAPDPPRFDFASGGGNALFAISAGPPLALGADFLPDDLDVSDRLRDLPPREAKMVEFLTPEARASAVVGHQAEQKAVQRLERCLELEGAAGPADCRVERLRMGANYVAALAVEGWDWSTSLWSFR
jgi:hypothetical protein